MDVVPRLLTRKIEEALADTPVVLVMGARQVGKTTLVRELIKDARYVTLDDPIEESAARADPPGFLERGSLAQTTIIDEIQRVPQLLQAIKLCVDRDRRPGNFVLTGSANILALPRISESLAGRMEILTLGPFSQLELCGRPLPPSTFVDASFAERLPQWEHRAPRIDLFERMLAGGYPESRHRSAARREAWFRSYTAGVLQREVREIARVADLERLPRLLGIVAQRSAQPLNKTRLSSDLGLAWNTVDTYLAILKATFLIGEIGAWSRSSNARITRQTKMVPSDSGLASALLGLKTQTLFEPTTPLGALVETFVAGELLRLRAGSAIDFDLLHYRTQRGEEVDFVMERRGGGVVGIEVKAAATVSVADFRGIDALRRDAGTDFVRGIVLHTGDTTASFGHDRFAVPLSALWDEAS